MRTIRAETVGKAATYREAFKYRHRLVPIHFTNCNGKRLLCLGVYLCLRSRAINLTHSPGLWKRWRDPQTTDHLLTFSIVTTDPNEIVEPLHNQIPVIIAKRHL